MTETLARHGVAYRFNFLAGLPFHDDDGEIAGFYGETPMWREDDLTPDQEGELQAWIAEHLAARPQDDPLWVRWATLERNGVQHRHRRGKPIHERRPAYGFECSMCKAYVVTTDPSDVQFVGGPVDGRWYVVPPDRQEWMVPVPQPVSVAVATEPLSTASPTSETAIYRRGLDGRFYHAG